MREIPILFSAEMVRAILAWPTTQRPHLAEPKTQTRRLRGLDLFNEEPDRWRYDGENTDGDHLFFDVRGDDPQNRTHVVKCPYGKPGDLLWVRETWAKDSLMPNGTRYSATDEIHELRVKRPSIHMHRWRSRIDLENTKVRAQRLQDISEEDARAEGVPIDDLPCDHVRHTCDEIGCLGPGYRSSFCELWNKINGKKHPWSGRPWVWAISFRLLEVRA